MDIGIEPFFVSSSLLMIVAQRLIRKLCDKCKEPYTPNLNKLPTNFKLTAEKLYMAKGCERCSKTGYAGRMPIFEILYMTEVMQEMIIRHAPVAELRNEARKNGMRTIEESGYAKMNLGLTSLEEGMRVTMSGGV